jgi:hypothetical protein
MINFTTSRRSAAVACGPDRINGLCVVPGYPILVQGGEWNAPQRKPVHGAGLSALEVAALKPNMLISLYSTGVANGGMLVGCDG